MHLELRRLSEIHHAEIIALNTNPLVRRQMPLSSETFEEAECAEWVAGKEKQWEEFGYRPWAFVIDGQFAGWGGLQDENGDADLGLVLHPDFWGTGKTIYDAIIARAFGEVGLGLVTTLLPPSRSRVKAILRLGFQPDGEVELYGERWIRYRLFAPKKEVIRVSLTSKRSNSS